MDKYAESLNNRLEDIESLYYISIFKKNENNNKIISTQAIFKTVYCDEYVASTEGTCQGILFVIKGTIKI